jgi:hypothetical protein
MMAGLVDSVGRELYCGAIIVSQRHVLTAAHCVIKRNANKIGVLVGDHDLTTGEHHPSKDSRVSLSEGNFNNHLNCAIRKFISAEFVLVDYELFLLIVNKLFDVSGADTNASRLFVATGFNVHPFYDDTSLENDIAIVTVNGTINFSQEVGPACLPFQHQSDSFAGNYVDLLGKRYSFTPLFKSLNNGALLIILLKGER